MQNRIRGGKATMGQIGPIIGLFKPISNKKRLLTSRRAEHGGASTKEELGGTGKTSTEEVSNPVQPLVIPDTREQSRAEGTSRVESTTGNGTTEEGKEAQSKTDGNGGKTSLGVTTGGINSELLTLTRSAASRFFGRSGLDRIESRSEDDINEDVREDEFHQELR